MWLILQHNKADDFVCSTGVSHTVQELVDYVFNKIELDQKKYVSINPKYLRPEELDVLKGDCSKIKSELNWHPEFSFEEMLDDMISKCFNIYQQNK